MIIGTFVLLTVRCRGKESNLFHEIIPLNTGSASRVLARSNFRLEPTEDKGKWTEDKQASYNI